jgi:hypothetical protein
MRSILDKALAALLEGKREEADKLFHDFVLDRARQVNESIVENGSVSVDEIVGEDVGQEESIEEGKSFKRNDDDEGDVKQKRKEEKQKRDDRKEQPVEEGKTFKRGQDDDEETAEEKKKQDQQRKAGAKQKRDVSEGKLEITQVEDGTLTMVHHVADETPVEPPVAEPAEFPGVEALNSDFEFESLRESLADELKKIVLDTKDGDFAVTGNAGGETHSPVPNVDAEDRADGAAAVEIDSDEHNGFDLEAGPKAESLGGENVHKKASDSLVAASKEGDKSALLNQIGTDAKAKSPIAGK